MEKTQKNLVSRNLQDGVYLRIGNQAKITARRESEMERREKEGEIDIFSPFLSGCSSTISAMFWLNKENFLIV